MCIRDRVYLRLPYKSLKRRLGDLKKRGVVLKPGQTLKDLVDYRTPYYEKYADLIVDEENLDIRGVVERIVSVLESVE